MGLLDTLQGVYNNGAPVRKGLLDLLTGKANVGGLLGDITALNNANYVNKLSQLSKGKFDPQNDQTAQFAMGMNPMMALHTVWHGSPHTFDKFDMSKIGTGEGAQAFGHGLYFAENPKVAESYQNAGIGNIDWENATYGGKKIQSLYDNAQRMQDLGHRMKNQSMIDKANAELYYWESLLTGTHPNIARSNALDPDAGWPTLQNFVKTIDDKKFKNINFPDTSLYKVDIPDEAIPKMLDWDKPLIEQRNIIDLLDKHPQSEYFNSYKSDKTDFPNNPELWKTGKSLYGHLDEIFGNGGGSILKHGDGASAAQELKKLGITGIKYLDGGSRGTGNGSYNYVTFDDNLPKILERNGVPLK